MKSLSQFSILEILQLSPLWLFLKQLRNDAWLSWYKRKEAFGEKEFLIQNQHLANKNILIVIAFEQPKVLEWLFEFANKNLVDFQLMIFDNSRTDPLRAAVKNVCLQYGVPYLGLPLNTSRHPNRSHGMAMTWVFERIIKKIKPSWFGYLDHDMVPVAPISSAFIHSQQPFYGMLNSGHDCWNLWAGYCFFNYEKVKNLPLNFLYDFSMGLDTGGRNWHCMYKNHANQNVQFAPNVYQDVKVDQTQATIQLVDGQWLHIGGVSYNNNLASKEAFYEQLIGKLHTGQALQDFYI